MTAFNDAKRSSLIANGAAPAAIPDMEFEWLGILGGTGSTRADRWFEIWDTFNIAPGSFNDRAMAFLAAIGHGVGTLNDRWFSFFESGDVVTLGIMQIGNNAVFFGFSDPAIDNYGSIDPVRIQGMDFDMTEVRTFPDNDNVLIRLTGDNFQPGVHTITYELFGVPSVDLVWDGTVYEATNVALSDFIVAEDGNFVDGLYLYATVAPTIDVQPASVDVPQETVTVLTVTATDASPSGITGYQWFEDDVEIPGEILSSLSVAVGFEIEDRNFTVEVFNSGPDSVLSDIAVVSVVEANLYVNFELVGGALSAPGNENPPTDHDLGFSTVVSSQPIDVGGGLFHWHSNIFDETGRMFLTYSLTDNNLTLPVGVYEFTYDVENTNPGGGGFQVFTSPSGDNIAFEYINRDMGAVGEVVTVGSTLTVTGPLASSITSRVGNGISSNNSRACIISNPRLVKVGNI